MVEAPTAMAETLVHRLKTQKIHALTEAMELSILEVTVVRGMLLIKVHAVSTMTMISQQMRCVVNAVLEKHAQTQAMAL